MQTLGRSFSSGAEKKDQFENWSNAKILSLAYKRSFKKASVIWVGKLNLSQPLET